MCALQKWLLHSCSGNSWWHVASSCWTEKSDWLLQSESMELFLRFSCCFENKWRIEKKIRVCPIQLQLGQLCTHWRLWWLHVLGWFFHHWLPHRCWGWFALHACGFGGCVCMHRLHVVLSEPMRSCGLDLDCSKVQFHLGAQGTAFSCECFDCTGGCLARQSHRQCIHVGSLRGDCDSELGCKVFGMWVWLLATEDMVLNFTQGLLHPSSVRLLDGCSPCALCLCQLLHFELSSRNAVDLRHMLLQPHTPALPTPQLQDRGSKSYEAIPTVSCLDIPISFKDLSDVHEWICGKTWMFSAMNGRLNLSWMILTTMGGAVVLTTAWNIQCGSRLFLCLFPWLLESSLACCWSVLASSCCSGSARGGMT